VCSAALSSCYLGTAVDFAPAFPASLHSSVHASLAFLRGAGFFNADMTQPFGMGTPLARTYVTRCLLGDEGMSYK
jgi:hypothetical protein